MRIGEVATATGLDTQTIRFYERKGLLPQPRRGPNSYRVYDPRRSPDFSSSVAARGRGSPSPRSPPSWNYAKKVPHLAPTSARCSRPSCARLGRAAVNSPASKRNSKASSVAVSDSIQPTAPTLRSVTSSRVPRSCGLQDGHRVLSLPLDQRTRRPPASSGSASSLTSSQLGTASGLGRIGCSGCARRSGRGRCTRKNAV